MKNRIQWLSFISGLLLGLYSLVLYLGYWKHPVRCLECNQVVEESSQLALWLGHQNVVHFECLEDLRIHAEALDKSMSDFIIHKAKHEHDHKQP